MTTKQGEWARGRSLGAGKRETIARVEGEREVIETMTGVRVPRAALIDVLLNEALDMRDRRRTRK